jgi:hypothetical protein
VEAEEIAILFGDTPLDAGRLGAAAGFTALGSVFPGSKAALI